MSKVRDRDAVLWRLIFPNLRRQERERFVFLAILAAVVMLAQTAGLAGADALFLAEYGAEALPLAFILASVVAVTGSVAYTFAVGRSRNDKLFMWLLVGSGVVLLGGAVLLFRGQRWTLYGFFSAVYVTQAVFVSLHFPTLAADYFDTVSSKRVLPYLIGCSSFGGIFGGLLALGLARVAPAEWLLVAWAVFLLIAAALLYRARRNLLRWMPVGADADETSSEGMLAAMRFLGRSALSRWLTIAVVGLVFALFLMQYLEMEIFVTNLESQEALASFIATYLAVANGVEIIVALWLAPLLIRRFGLAQANLVHSLMTLVVFGVLALKPTLWVAVLARANRELMDNALAGPIRGLVYNALAFRFRGRMRAFLEGIVFYAAMSSAGLALLLLGDSLDATLVCLIGGAAAIIYFGANLMVRREYIESIVDELRSGRLDLEGVSANLGDLEITRLAEAWEKSVASGEQPSRGWRDLPAVLIRHGVREPLERNTRRGHAAVRVACIEALASEPDEALGAILVEALVDSDQSVRLAATTAVDAVPNPSAGLTLRLEACLDDLDLRIRARAASHLGEAGVATLREMVSDAEPAAAVEALPWLPKTLLPEARARLDDTDPEVRAAALDCVARLGDKESLAVERLERELAHEHVEVRLAATRALGTLEDEVSAPLLARALDDGGRSVRTQASDTLGRMGDVGVRAARPAVASIRRWTADAALRAVASAPGEESRAVLEEAFRQRVQEAWQMRAASALVPEDGDVPTRFLRTALEDAEQRDRWVALLVLELIEDPIVVRSVRKALGYADPRDRSDALEVLSNLGEREPASQLSLLLEEGSLEDKLPSLPATLELPTAFDEILELAESSPDRWLALAAVGRKQLQTAPLPPEVRTMESLLALRKVPLFAHLSLEQLEAIGHFMKEVRYLTGEVVVREGELGEVLFVMIEGEAVALKNYGTPDEIELTTMTPEGLCYFGEIAIFDSAPRSATVVILEDARLLRLEGERFMELIIQSPEISFEIFKVFTQRLRVAEERIRAQEDQERLPESESGAS